ncbi:MAG: hypothetical protein JO291_16155 [Acidimicrobiia bacterium]|nr:hypothetical protein [Acidimicrobiia bacterium]
MALIETDEALERPGLILRTEIRGVPVTACWEHGQLSGDAELVRRVTNLAVWRQVDVADLAPAQVISLAREACAGPIETELVLSDGADHPTAPGSRSSRRT